MKAIDLQLALMSKENGGLIRDAEMLAQLASTFKSSDALFQSEQELVQQLRHHDVKSVILGGGWKILGWKDFGEIQGRNDYIGELKRKYSDVVAGFWVGIDPDWGLRGFRELERCIRDLGSYGIAVGGALTGVPANDKAWDPYYELCIEAKVPVKIWIGHLGIEGKVSLRTENPIPYVDDVACKFPELTIICAHHPWPFENEMVSVLIRHPNVYNEQHGTAPRYFAESFRKEINSRIQDKVMFGSDYPLFTYEKLFQNWESAGYKPEVLEKVYRKNAQRVLGLGS